VPRSWHDFANRKLPRPALGWSFISLSGTHVQLIFEVPAYTWSTDEEFAPAQLSPKEFGDYLGVVYDALNATEGGAPCTSQISPYTLPESLRNFVTLRQIGDLCVLAESTVFNGTRFEKGLPLIALRSRLASSRPVHISTATFLLLRQTAAVFEHTGARSYIASTRSRAAYAKQGCGKLSNGEPVVPGWVTDAAHHDVRSFHVMTIHSNHPYIARNSPPSSPCTQRMARSPRRLPQCNLCIHTTSRNDRHGLPERHSFHLNWNRCVEPIQSSPTSLTYQYRNPDLVCFHQPCSTAREPIHTSFEDCHIWSRPQLDGQHTRDLQMQPHGVVESPGAGAERCAARPGMRPRSDHGACKWELPCC